VLMRGTAIPPEPAAGVSWRAASPAPATASTHAAPAGGE
jgi:hypothetical protein